jgi:hypothetical protein
MSDCHPAEADLALLAGGDCSSWRMFQLHRHLARCGDCRDTFCSYTELRSALAEHGPTAGAAADLAGGTAAWESLAAEMRANIRVGLAAGECVREVPGKPARNWKSQWALGAAGVLLAAGAGVFLHGLLPHENIPDTARAAVLESTSAGVRVRTAAGSMTLLNGAEAGLNGGEAGSQTVTSDGAIRSSNVDGATGTVTVTSVYVE